MTSETARQNLRSIAEETTDARVERMAHEALTDLEDGGGDPYTARVVEFHRKLRESTNDDYLTVIAERFDHDELPVPAETPPEAESMLAEIWAERNRLFWAAFLAEESGEVASCLTDGEDPEDFHEEVADVLILCHAIADCFEFDLMRSFQQKMDENDRKPMVQGGTGKLPDDARDEWRGDQ